MKEDNEVERFWLQFVEKQSEYQEPASKDYEVWHFCDNKEAANELAALAVNGIKTATSSLLWAYEAEGEMPPQVGDLSIITDWDGKPFCLVETIRIQIKPFNEVDRQVAYDEGEGDRSLEYWRRVHWDAFSRECESIGREPAETMPVINEWFRVLFPLS